MVSKPQYTAIQCRDEWAKLSKPSVLESMNLVTRNGGVFSDISHPASNSKVRIAWFPDGSTIEVDQRTGWLKNPLPADLETV